MERNTKHKLEFLPRLCAVFCLVLMLVLTGCGGSGGGGGSRGNGQIEFKDLVDENNNPVNL